MKPDRPGLQLWDRLLLVLVFGLCLLGLSVSADAQRVFTLSSNGTLRLLENPDCTGAECRWVDIDRNPRTLALTATTDQIFQLHSTGAIWRWEGLPCADGACPSWKRIDNNPQAVAIAAGFDAVFQLHRNGSIWRWRGDDCSDAGCLSWTRIDNRSATRAIVAAGDQLFQLHENGEIWRWKGRDCDGERCDSWECLDRNSMTVEIDFAARGNLFQRHRNGSIWRWDGRPCSGSSCPSWSRLDRNAATVDILAAPGNLFQRHRDGGVWRWTGRACDGDGCPHWLKIGAISRLVDIAAGAQPYGSDFTNAEAGAAPVYGLHDEGRVVRWTGADCAARRCPDWTDMGDAFAAHEAPRGKLFVFPGPAPDPDNRLVVIPPRPGDIDGDGLPDAWERDNGDRDVVVGRADLIVVPVVRPEVTESDELQQTLMNNLAAAKNFFRNLPLRTERGVRGIHIHIADGQPLDDRFHEDADPVIGYRDIRVAGMPPELIGYAHGMLFGTGRGGGGQTSGPDWSTLGMDWRTIVHELGHQLGLGHTPRGGIGQSPLYRSLMNYDYSYGIAGDGNDIRFSDGRFSSVRLDERNLDEVLPFTADELSFLTFDPYEFDVEPIDHGSASLDWNRNGVHRERNISADINDGVALEVGNYNHVGSTHGDVAIAASGDHFVVFRTELPEVRSSEYAGFGASPDSPARLAYTVVREREILSSGTILSTPVVVGNPTAITMGSRILAAAPSESKTVQLGAFKISSDGELSGRFSVHPLEGFREMTLVSDGSTRRVELILWDPETNRLSARQVTIGSSLTLGAERPIVAPDGSPLISAAPPGASYNSKTDNIVLLIADPFSFSPNRLKLCPIRLSGSRYVAERGRWLADGGARSLDKPAFVFDGSPRAGGEGRYLVYYRRIDGERHLGRHGMEFVRVTPAATVPGGPEDPYVFRRRQVINQWVHTRNPPAVAPYKDDYVMVWRTPEHGWDERARNQAEVNLFASGESASTLADHDDIGWIARSGMLRIVPLQRR